MGTRAQVYFPETKIYLYQHYDGYNLPNTVRDALKRGKDRWDDPEYLARIVFCEMIRDDIDGTAGYGIDAVRHDDIEYLVTLDTNRQRVIVQNIYEESCLSFSFDEYINRTQTSW